MIYNSIIIIYSTIFILIYLNRSEVSRRKISRKSLTLVNLMAELIEWVWCTSDY